MEKIKEIRMTLVILIVGIFFLSGCFFSDTKTITFKTNGGSEIKNISVKNGTKASDLPVPTKDGYIFDGWYLDGEEYDSNKVVEEDLTLVAKWIKDTNNEVIPEEETTTTTTKSTKTTTIKSSKTINTTKTIKKTTKKKKTTTRKTSKEDSTPVKTSAQTTTTTTKKIPVIPNVEVTKTTAPVVILPTEPEDPKPVEPELKPVDIKLELIKEENAETEESELEEYLKLTKTTKETNVTSIIDDEDLNNLLASDISTWVVVSNHAYTYENTAVDDTIILKGDKDVTSFTVVFNETSVIFDYDDEEKHWVIKYPTVSVGTGLDVIYYRDLKTAIDVSKEGDTIKILSNQDIIDNLIIKTPIIIEADNHKITNQEGYLFNLENIEYSEDSKFEINNLELEVDSFIYVGKSKFDNIILNNITGNIKNNKIDKKENGEFENTYILQHF